MAKNDWIKTINKPFLTAYPTNFKVEIPNVASTIILLDDTYYPSGGYDTYSINQGNISITAPNGSTDVLVANNITTGTDYTFRTSGTYVIRYYGETRNGYFDGSSPATLFSDFNVAFYISVIDNKLPLKKWTVTDVINRVLALAEPLRSGERPKFYFQGVNVNGGGYAQGSQAEMFDKILAPEFAFTKQTLRECLREIGGFIHGEPRLTVKKDPTIGYYYEVSYDLYAQQDKSDIWYKPYVSLSAQRNIENYAGYLDSNAENLVNQLDKYSGVIVEPYARGAKTVRAVQSYVRIDETTMEIATQYPIYTVDDIEYVYKDGSSTKSVSLKPWLFEESIYRTQLSSYESVYPYSKAYGLYYTQGEKNIKALNFKEDASIFPAFKNYSIINVLRQALNDSGFSVDNYASLAFRVTYTPFYDIRVAQTKPYIEKGMRQSALIYNQQANVIESRAFGENLKGVIARIGNVELSITKIVPWFGDIPRAGQLYKKDYYISAVAVAVYANYIRVTLGLSKDFNRLSQYIGISSVKRYYEVSQTQAVERSVLYRDYILITQTETGEPDTLICDSMMIAIQQTFIQTGNITPCTNVYAQGASYRLNPDNLVLLPVISSAVGNSISFSWRYEDNYSAGAYADDSFSANGISGYWQNDTPYADYYGRIYYYYFAVTPSGIEFTADVAKRLPNTTTFGQNIEPFTYMGTGLSHANSKPMILRKDNREKLQVNVQIDFVTDIQDFIIGSALAAYNPAVRGTDSSLAPMLYVFDKPLNKFTNNIQAMTGIDINSLPSVPVTARIATQKVNGKSVPVVMLTAQAFPASGKAWAIATKQTTTSEHVEDEIGSVFTQTVTKGGDLIIGQNMEVIAGNTLKTIYLVPRHNVFETSIWKDKI